MIQDHTRKRVLTIAFDFPPRRTSGVFRIVSLTSRLVHLEWLPTVLTIQRKQGDIEDASLLSNSLDEVRVVRTNFFDVSAWENRVADNVKATGALKSAAIENKERRIDRWLRWLADTFRNLAYFPDESVGWIPTGLFKAIELHMQQRFDLIYTTGPPRAAVVIGLLMKKLFGAPWVSEYRDPWYPARRPRRRRAERWLQRRLLRDADALVVVTEGHANDLKSTYGVPSHKLTVIRNGFDQRDFNHRPELACSLFTPGMVHFTHFGTIYPGLPGKFFEAVKELARDSPEAAKKFRINIIGYADEIALQYTSDESLQGIVKLHGFLRHGEAVEAMRSTDHLLLFLGDRDFARLAVPGKLYEYLPAGRPILALTYDGETKNLIEQYKAGRVVDPDDTEAIKRALMELSASNTSATGPIHHGAQLLAEEFGYDRLAEKLADVFNSVIRNGK